MLNSDEIRFKIHKFILELQTTLNLSDKELGEYFSLTGSNVKKILTGRADLKALNLIEATDHFNISIDAILEERIDYAILEKHFFGEDCVLPPRYSAGAFGKKRTVNNILNYFEKNYGVAEKMLLLRKFQLKLGHFENSDELINNFFIVDLMNEVSRRGYSSAEILKMGEFSFYCNKDGSVGEALRVHKTSKELLGFFFEEAINSFDSNYNYKIEKLTNDFCEVRLHQNQDVLDALKTKRIGSPVVSLMKSGVIKSLPRYIGREDLNVSINKSVFNNDSYCSYKINFNENFNPQFQLQH